MIHVNKVAQYTAILHQHGVGSVEASEFRTQNQYNDSFVERAQQIDRLFRIKDEVILIEG